MSKIKSAASTGKKKAIDAIVGGKLEKACFVIYKAGQSYDVDRKVEVQFNPSEYSIRRGVRLSDKRPMGRDSSANEVQAVYGEPSSLSVSLYFDSYTELLSGGGLVNKGANKGTDFLKSTYNKFKPDILPNSDMDEESSPNMDYAVNQRFHEFLEMIKYSTTGKTPPQVGFVWGEHLHFVGKIASYDAQYTLFEKNGTPVRAKLTLQMVGEELSLTIKEMKSTSESADLTKQRDLPNEDQLWMLAKKEYGNPGQWKTIAGANGILNPRVMTGASRLTVPSIR